MLKLIRKIICIVVLSKFFKKLFIAYILQLDFLLCLPGLGLLLVRSPLLCGQLGCGTLRCTSR